MEIDRDRDLPRPSLTVAETDRDARPADTEILGLGTCLIQVRLVTDDDRQRFSWSRWVYVIKVWFEWESSVRIKKKALDKRKTSFYE